MLGTETVYVGGDLVRDSNNNTVATAGIGDVEGCQVQPLSSAELVERGRTGTEDAVQVFLPVTDGINSTSLLTIRGKKYQIDGNPQPYIDPEDPELSGYDITATRRLG